MPTFSTTAASTAHTRGLPVSTWLLLLLLLLVVFFFISMLSFRCSFIIGSKFSHLHRIKCPLDIRFN
jgi:hypothetical protein